MRPKIFAILLMLGMLPANTWAQARHALPSWSVAQRSGSPADGWPQDPIPQFSVPPLAGRASPPLPRIGLPLPPIGLRPPSGRPNRPRHHWPGRFTSWNYMVVVVPESAATVPVAVAAEPPSGAAKGSLVLEVQPATSQVFVDGFYAGEVDDFSGRRGGAFLEPGAHAVDIVAPGYEPVAFDVKIVPNESVVYRRQLQAAHAPAPAAAPISKTPTMIYMIPGCYVGNVPPKEAGLPATCDLSRALRFVM